jgi:glycerol-3-phosphate dehydrogenase
MVNQNPSTAKLIESQIGVTRAEVEFVISEEFPKTLPDLMARRLVLAFEGGHGLNVVEEIAAIMAEKLGWSSSEITRQVEGYKQWLDHLAIPDENGPRSTNFGAKQLSESK